MPVPGYEGDWKSDGVDNEGKWWFSCNEGCGGIDVVGVSADSIVEQASASQAYLLQLQMDSSDGDPLAPAKRVADADKRRRSERTLPSASPVEGPSLVGEVLGDVVVEIAYDAIPGVGQAHDLDGMQEALAAHQRAPTLQNKVGVGLAGIGFVPLGSVFKVFGRRVDDAINFAPNMGKGTSGVTIQLKRPDGVSDSAWQKKLDALNDAAAKGEAKVVHKPSRNGAAQRQARKEGRIDAGDDADHALDLQFGGADDITNIMSTGKRVNRSVGAQGRKRLQHSDGTPIEKFVEE